MRATLSASLPPRLSQSDHPAGIAFRQPYSCRPPRKFRVRRDIDERRQCEGALRQPRMRDLQSRLVDPRAAIEENVNVDGARSPAFAALAPELFLHREDCLE